MAGPKHSTNVPLSAEFPVPLNVEEKEVAFVPNPVPDLAVKALSRPQSEEGVDLCTRTHSVPTLQVVTPLMFPKTVHPKVNASAGQVGEAGENCPAASPEEIRTNMYVPEHLLTHVYIATAKYVLCLRVHGDHKVVIHTGIQ